jgi:hypothetical protein
MKEYPFLVFDPTQKVDVFFSAPTPFNASIYHVTIR